MIDGAEQAPQQFVKLTSVVVGGTGLEMDLHKEPEVAIAVAEPTEQMPDMPSDINRWRQIVDLADSPEQKPFENAPNEKYADIEAVTSHAGGGLNGPKHPHDLRIKDPSMYPNQQEY